jgi:hypothetical protein
MKRYFARNPKFEIEIEIEKGGLITRKNYQARDAEIELESFVTESGGRREAVKERRSALH